MASPAGNAARASASLTIADERRAVAVGLGEVASLDDRRRRASRNIRGVSTVKIACGERTPICSNGQAAFDRVAAVRSDDGRYAHDRCRRLHAGNRRELRQEIPVEAARLRAPRRGWRPAPRCRRPAVARCGSRGRPRLSAAKLRISRPAPITSTTAAAVSNTISAARIRPLPPPDIVRPPCFMTSFRSLRDAWSAGARPKIRLAASDAADANKQHAEIDVHLVDARQACRRKRDQPADTPCRDHHARDAGERRRAGRSP